MVARYLPEAKARPQAPRLAQHQVRQRRAAKQKEAESVMTASEVRWVTIVDRQ